MNTKKAKPVIKYISRVISKSETQLMIKALRGAALEVQKLDAGYVCFNKNGCLLFKAMRGNNGYLVRMASDLFE